MSAEGRWGHSRDGELYTGFFDTREEALAEARANDSEFIGQYRDPISPEACIEADLLTEHVLCQDDYCGEWAEGVLDFTKEQEAELTAAIRRVFGEWIDRHGLRPGFGIVEKPETVEPEMAD